MKSRYDLIEQVIMDCLDELFRASQPSITLDEYKEKCKSDPTKHWFEYHYLSQEQFTDIEESYIYAYRIRNEFHDNMECVKEYLKNGGTKDKWITPEDGSPGYRGYEKTPKLSELIGEEAAQKALDLIEECNKFYQPHTEENRFRFNVSNFGPCCNIETVRENNPGVTIYERRYDDEWDKWRNVDENGNFIYEPEELDD